MSVSRPDLLVIGLDPAGLETALGMAAASRPVVLVTQGPRPALVSGGLDPLVRLAALGGRVIEGEARWRDRHHIYVAGETLRPRRTVLALSARDDVPRITGLDAAPRWQPGAPATTVLVLGSGPHAPALAQAARREGHRAILVAPEDLLPGFDKEGVAALAQSLKQAGIELHSRCALEGAHVVPCPEGYLLHPAQGAPIGFSHWACAEQAPPDLSGLGLEAAGVLIEHGRASCPGGLVSDNGAIFAVGASRSPFADAANARAEAGMALGQILFGLRSAGREQFVPRIAHGPLSLIEAGMSDSALAGRARGSLRYYRVPLAGGGFLKAVTGRGGKLERICILAQHAPAFAAPLLQALAEGRPLASLARLPLPQLEEADALAALGRQALGEHLVRPGARLMMRLVRLLG